MINSTLATNTLLLKKQIITTANIHIFVISRYLYCVDKTVCILTIGLQIITTINCLKTIPSIGKAQNKINATHNVSTVLFPIFFTRQIYVFSIFSIFFSSIYKYFLFFAILCAFCITPLHDLMIIEKFFSFFLLLSCYHHA